MAMRWLMNDTARAALVRWTILLVLLLTPVLGWRPDPFASTGMGLAGLLLGLGLPLLVAGWLSWADAHDDGDDALDHARDGQKQVLLAMVVFGLLATLHLMAASEQVIGLAVLAQPLRWLLMLLWALMLVQSLVGLFLLLTRRLRVRLPRWWKGRRASDEPVDGQGPLANTAPQAQVEPSAPETPNALDNAPQTR